MNGVAALVKLAVFLDDQCGIEILSIGREGLDREHSCTLVAMGEVALLSRRYPQHLYLLEALAHGSG